MAKQASVNYETPEPFEVWPKFETAQQLVAWLHARYADYPAYLDLVLLGGVDFMGIDHAQGALHAG